MVVPRVKQVDPQPSKIVEPVIGSILPEGFSTQPPSPNDHMPQTCEPFSESDQVIFPPCKVAALSGLEFNLSCGGPPPCKCKCGGAQQRRRRQSNLNHLAVAKNQSTAHSQLSSHRQHELSCCRWRRAPTAGRGLERSKAARCVAAHARALIDTIFPRI